MIVSELIRKDRFPEIHKFIKKLSEKHHLSYGSAIRGIIMDYMKIKNGPPSINPKITQLSKLLNKKDNNHKELIDSMIKIHLDAGELPPESLISKRTSAIKMNQQVVKNQREYELKVKKFEQKKNYGDMWREIVQTIHSLLKNKPAILNEILMKLNQVKETYE